MRGLGSGSLKMCLFESEIEWMENFREKMEMKTFLVGVWLEGEEGKKLVRPGCFLPRHTKMFSL